MTHINILAAEILEAAACVIQLDGWWTQGHFARTESGAPIMTSNRMACAFCAVGAIEAAAGRSRRLIAHALTALQQQDMRYGGSTLNDISGMTGKRMAALMIECADKLRSEA